MSQKEIFESAPIILAAPGKRLLYELNGVDEDSVQVVRKTNKTHTISFTVNKYISGILSNGYDWIEEQMEIYCDGMWFVINTPPTIEYDGYQEVKNVSAESLEIRLLQYPLNNFAVNQGSDHSYEMMYREEHPTDSNGNKVYYQVKFYNPNEPMLSYLHLVLYHANVPEWTIGYVDDITVNSADGKTLLPDEIVNFDVDEQSVYAHLTQDVAQAARCIFEFDTVNMKINVYRPESLGKDTNIVIDFHNIQNSININRDNQLVTAFNVTGSDINIDYVNPVGGSVIEDLTQLANEKYMGKELADKYLAWIKLRDSYVQPYMELSKEYHGLLTTISELYNRVPSDTVQNDYYSMTEEDLKESYNSAIAIVNALENKYQDVNGNLNLEALKTSPDWEIYASMRNYVIPTIIAAFQGKQADIPDNTDYYGLGNLLKNSVPISFGNNSWTIIGSGNFLCTNLDEQPDYGMTSAIQVKPTNTAGFEQTSIQTTIGNNYCLSVYVKATTNMTVNLQFGVALNRDKRITKTFEISAGTWHRIHANFKAENKLADIAFTCSGNGEVLFTGMMLEIGTAPTAFSYYKLSDSELKSFETDWKLYGIDELQSKLEVYQNSVDILTKNGYNEPYDENTSKDEPYHIKMHQQYLDYINLRDACKTALEERITEVKPYETQRDTVQGQRTNINELLKKENFGTSQSEFSSFTNKELVRLNILKNQNSYSNPNIIVTSIDTLQDEVDIQKRLYDDAMDQLYVESHYQYQYSDSIDNILDLPEFALFKGDMDVNNFIRVGIDDNDTYVKLRVIEMSYNPCKKENDLQLVFSNVVNYRSKVDDLAHLINEAPNASSRGQIVGSGTNSTASFFFTPELISQLVSNPNFQSSLGGLTVGGSGYSGTSGFATAGGDGSVTITADRIISALVKAEQGQFETITAETGFFKYLDTKLLSADRVVTKVLEAEQAEIDELTAKIVTSDSVVTKMLEADQAIVDQLTAKMITADNAVLGTIVTEKLNAMDIQANSIEVGKITGNEGSFNQFFINHLDVNEVFGDNAEFKNLVAGTITADELTAKMAKLDEAHVTTIFAGTAFADRITALSSTTAKATIDSAYITDIVAAEMTVADLKAGDITLSDSMRILSENGMMVMDGTVLQIMGTDTNGNKYVGVQLGYDTTNTPSLILRNEKGETILQPSGITDKAISDGLIKNNMVGEGEISKDKLDFKVTTNDDGVLTVTIHEVIDEDGNVFGDSYTQFKQNVISNNNSIANLQTNVTSVLDLENGTIKESAFQNTYLYKPVLDENGDYTYDAEGNIVKEKDAYSIIERQMETIRGFDKISTTLQATSEELGHIASTAEQTAEKFTWLVTNGSTSSDLTITQNAITAISEQMIVKSPDGSATVIEGGKLSTEAIKSINYSPSDNPDSPYSAFGTYLNLQNGNFYTPNFGIDNIYGKAYLNGEIIASSGSLGFGINYWEISTLNDYNMNQSAALIGHGTSYIQAGNWQISNNKINTQSYANNRTITYLNDGTNYYDYGMQVPKFDTTVDYIQGVSDNFLYIRKSPQNTIPVMESDWIYLFRVDKDGNIYEGGQKLSEKYAALGTEGVYVPLKGNSTIEGDLTVTGKLNANVTGTTGVLTIGGKTFNGSGNISVSLNDIGAIGAKMHINGRYVMTDPTGKTSDFIHTTEYGLLPYEAGGAGKGHGYLGTSTWYFAHAYIDTIYGNLIGTAQKATQDAEGNNIAETYLRKGDASIVNPLKITYNGATHTFTGATETTVNINALPLSGGTMDANSFIYCIADDGRKARFYNSGIEFQCRSDDAGWTQGMKYNNYGSSETFGYIGMYGYQGKAQYYFFGDYKTPIAKIDLNGNVTATSFIGNATSASKLETARNITVGNATKSFDGSKAISFSLSEIASNASSSSAGWMSATDKSKLDSIEVDSSGNITALSIVAGNGISVTTNASGQSVVTNTQYAPTTSGTSGYIVQSNGTNTPTWVNPAEFTIGLANRLAMQATPKNCNKPGLYVIPASNATPGNTADYSIDTPNAYSNEGQYGTILRIKYNNDSVYYTDIWSDTNANNLYFKTVSNGSSKGWHRVLTNQNYSSYAIAKTGGDLSGKLTLQTTGSAGIGIYESQGGQLILGHNNTISSGTVVGSQIYETVIRSSTTTNLYHTIGDSNKYPILTSANFSSYAVAKTGGQMTGTLQAPNITITSTNAVQHLAFSRHGFNYITAPSDGAIGFVLNDQGVGSATSSIIITNTQVYPGADKTISLGRSSSNWQNVYTNIVTVSNAVTITYNSTTETLNFSFA